MELKKTSHSTSHFAEEMKPKYIKCLYQHQKARAGNTIKTSYPSSQVQEEKEICSLYYKAL